MEVEKRPDGVKLQKAPLRVPVNWCVEGEGEKRTRSRGVMM